MIWNLMGNEYIYSVLTKVLTITINILQSIILARYFGPTFKGSYTYINSIVAIASIVLTYGMQEAYPHLRIKYKKEKIYDLYLSTILIAYLIYFIISTVIVMCVPVRLEIKIIIALVPLFGYSMVVEYIELIENPNLRNKWWTLIYLLNLGVLFFLWLFVECNLYIVACVLAIPPLLKSIIYTYQLGFKLCFSSDNIRLYIELVKIGFFPMIALLLTTLNYQIDVIMLKNFQYITAAEIGIYSISISVADKIVLIPDSLKGILASKLTKGADEREVAKVCRLSLSVSILIGLFFILFGKVGITILYGKAYSSAYTAMCISSVGAVLIGYFKLIGQYNIVKKKQILNVIMLLISVGCNIIFNLILIPQYGVNGAAVATSAGHIICGIVFIFWFSSNKKISVGDLIFIQKSDIRVVKKMHKRGEKYNNDYKNIE